MFTFKFFVRQDRQNALFLRITNNRKSARISLGATAAPEDLEDALSEKPNPLNRRLKSRINYWNSAIAEVQDALKYERRENADVGVIKQMIESRLEYGEIPSPEELASNIKESKLVKCATNFIGFMEQTGASKSKSTSESFTYTLNTIGKFSHKPDSLSFEDITYSWLSDFECWMKRNNLSQNTRRIHFANIRIAMREAYKRELTDCDPFRRFSFRAEKTRKRALGIASLRRLFGCAVAPYAEFHRDMFKLIFMLCGINTVDLYNLKSITSDGRIEYKRAKTGRLYSIKVEPEAMEIIQKYRGSRNLLCISDRWSSARNFRQHLNEAIQDIGKAHGKGIKRDSGPGEFEGVTSYWMRHSWATIARSLGISKDDISLALGHGDGNPVTSVYIDEDLRVVDEANRRVLDWVLYGKR